MKKPVAAAVSKAKYENAQKRYSANAREVKKLTEKSEKKIADEKNKLTVALGNMPEQMAEDAKIIEQYVMENREEMFGANKTCDFWDGFYTLRTNPHSLVLSAGVKEEELVEAFKKRDLVIYLTTKVSLNKKMIISDRDDKDLQKVLAKVGASVEQGETFSITVR